MKCHICFGHYEKHNAYPCYKELKSCGGKGGHDLHELKKTILSKYFLTHDIPVLLEDHEFLTYDKDLTIDLFTIGVWQVCTIL